MKKITLEIKIRICTKTSAMIFGEEVEFEDENIKVDLHQYIVMMLGRVSKTETSKLDIIGKCTPDFPADKMLL